MNRTHETSLAANSRWHLPRTQRPPVEYRAIVMCPPAVMGQSAQTTTNCICLASSRDGKHQTPQLPSPGRVSLPGFLFGPFSIAALISCCLVGPWLVSSSGAFETAKTADDQDKTQSSLMPDYVVATLQQLVGEWRDEERGLTATMHWTPDGTTLIWHWKGAQPLAGKQKRRKAKGWYWRERWGRCQANGGRVRDSWR